MLAKSPVVVITGASKGIGLAVTRILLETFHANVVAISRSRTPELNSLLSDSLLVVECDITNETALMDAIAQGVDRFRRIDGLILNAGTVEPLCRIGDDTALSLWKEAFDTNFFSLVSALKLTLPALRKSEHGGRVIFVSSGAAVGGKTGWGPYSASKAAMNSLCRTLSEEEPDVVSVSIRPGKVDTAMQSIFRQFGGAFMDKTDHEDFIRDHREGKLVKPEDCGHVIAALSLQAPRALNGQFVSWDKEECAPFRRQ